MRVLVASPNPVLREGVSNKLRQAGIVLADEPLQVRVVVAAADTVERAIRWCPAGYRANGQRLLVLADTFDPAEVRRALRLGARALLPTAADAKQLAAAVHATSQGEGRIPGELLLKLLSPPAHICAPAPSRSPLTPKQTAVLTLMADGHANGAIAETLDCSEHTVKNVIYELMARLQVRNRAHAVAEAIRTGLI